VRLVITLDPARAARGSSSSVRPFR